MANAAKVAKVAKGKRCKSCKSGKTLQHFANMQDKAKDIAYTSSRTHFSRCGDKALQRLQKWQKAQLATVTKVAESYKSATQSKRPQAKCT